MGYPLTTQYYKLVWLKGEKFPPTVVRLKPKFPKGKAEKKAWKRRTHLKGYYLMQRLHILT